MTMTPKPTLNELQDETLLRRTIAGVLYPKGLPHYCDEGTKPFDGYSVGSGKCERCGRDYRLGQECDVWYPDDRPMEVLIVELLQKCNPSDLFVPIAKIAQTPKDKMVYREKDPYVFSVNVFRIWIRMSPNKQAICCLLALGEAVVTKETVANE